MQRQRISSTSQLDPETYPLGENAELSAVSAHALVSLSHTPLEHRLYSAMLTVSEADDSEALFSVRSLVDLTGIRSPSTIRRGLDGLVVKLSAERKPKVNGDRKREQRSLYRVFIPSEVLERRRETGQGVTAKPTYQSFERAIARVVDNPMLSRREAQVALCCVEGLTNAEIGKRLEVTEQTVKFHLRHVFIKFRVRRRAELISKLLM